MDSKNYECLPTTNCLDKEIYENKMEESASSVFNVNYALPRTPAKGMESKILSLWHHVKYGWSGKMQVNFSKETIWLLGQCYRDAIYPTTKLNVGLAAQCTSSNAEMLDASMNTSQVEDYLLPQELGMDAVENQMHNAWEDTFAEFRRDFYSRIWFTYRREFPLLNGSNYTSDCGWGCMLRSGQMLLAQGLVCHFLGRGWRYDPGISSSVNEDNIHQQIIKWFGDSSSKASPFSIHTLVGLGEKSGRKPGDWYGPSSVSHLLRQALQSASNENSAFDYVSIHVAIDSTIYIGDIEEECCIKQSSADVHTVPWQTVRNSECSSREKEQWKSVLIFVPLRLGTEKFNPVYADCLKLLLSSEYCIGIIGGRPKHSLYFVGFQEDKLIHLDPHYCQEMVDVNQENYPMQSFHCKSPRKLRLAKMDPSCCVGFYCHTKADFYNFIESAQRTYPQKRAVVTTEQKKMMPQPSNTSVDDAHTKYPLFTVSEGRSLGTESNTCLPQISNQSQIETLTHKDDRKIEGFVFL